MAKLAFEIKAVCAVSMLLHNRIEWLSSSVVNDLCVCKLQIIYQQFWAWDIIPRCIVAMWMQGRPNINLLLKEEKNVDVVGERRKWTVLLWANTTNILPYVLGKGTRIMSGVTIQPYLLTYLLACLLACLLAYYTQTGTRVRPGCGDSDLQPWSLP